MSPKTPVLLIAATVVVMLALTAIGFSSRHTAEASPGIEAASTVPLAASALRLQVAEVSAAPMETKLNLPGLLAPWQQTFIHAQATGYVKRYLVDLGDTVRAGQVLAEIDAPTLDQDLLAARARVAQAEAQLALVRSENERSQKMVEMGIVSQQRADADATAVLAGEADLGVARAAQRSLLAQAGYKQVTAPFAGRITLRSIEAGQLVNGNTPLFTLADVSQLRVTVQVPQSNMRGVAAGLKAAISLREYPGEHFDGRVSRTAGALDAARTLATEVRLPNADGRLLAGASVDVQLTVPNVTQTVLIPANALMVSSKGTQVALLAGDVLRLVPVRLGRDLGKQIEVVEGLKVGDKVALSPPDTVQDGQRVAVIEPIPAKT
ncbi:MAG: efflux RND transporter periplasmic adaptor subunit [Pseudomonadota bacterium]